MLENVALPKSLYVCGLSFVRTILATSHVAGGDAEQGIAIPWEVVATAADLRSARTRRRYVREFVNQLAHYGNDPLIRDFQTLAKTSLAQAHSKAGSAP